MVHFMHRVEAPLIAYGVDLARYNFPIDNTGTVIQLLQVLLLNSGIDISRIERINHQYLTIARSV